MVDIYQIRIGAHIDDRWSDWLGGLDIRHHADGTSLLVGPLADQAALHGVLAGIRDLGLPLLSIECTPASGATRPAEKGRCL
jgi:hypothetical protein